MVIVGPGGGGVKRFAGRIVAGWLIVVPVIDSGESAATAVLVVTAVRPGRRTTPMARIHSPQVR